jgi:soluble lytic murein transglycosylase-like protein
MKPAALFVCLVRAWGQTAAPPAPAPPVGVPPASAAPVGALPAPVTTPPAAAPDPVAQMKAAMEKQRAAIALQRQAAAKQAEFAAKYRWSAPLTTTSVELAEPPSCLPLADAVLNPLLESAAARQGVELKVLRAVARQESGFRPCAVSPKGAKGLMQLMPATAAQLSVRDPFNPEESVQAGARYLKELLGKYNGDLKLALAAYNAGPGAVTEAGGIPDIAETKNYVQSILQAIGGAATTRSPPAQ